MRVNEDGADWGLAWGAAVRPQGRWIENTDVESQGSDVTPAGLLEHGGAGVVSEPTGEAKSNHIWNLWTRTRCTVYQDWCTQSWGKRRMPWLASILTFLSHWLLCFQALQYNKYEKSCRLPKTVFIPISQNRFLKVNSNISERSKASGKKEPWNNSQTGHHALRQSAYFQALQIYPCCIPCCKISPTFPSTPHRPRLVSDGCERCEILCKDSNIFTMCIYNTFLQATCISMEHLLCSRFFQ